MTKEQFLTDLGNALKKLPSSERDDIIHDYEEYFTIGLADGKTEEELAASLGSPRQLGRELSAVHHVDSIEGSNSVGDFFRALWAVVGLGFFNLVIVLGPFVALAGIVLSGWIFSIAFILMPLVVLVNTVIYPEIFEFYSLFFSIGLAGAGILLGIFMSHVTTWMKDLFVRYFKFNVRMVKGGIQDA